MGATDNIRIADGISFQDVNLIHKVSAHIPATSFPKDLLVPPAYEIIADGCIGFCLFYPEAKRVSIKTMAQAESLIDLEKDGDFWKGQTGPLEGFVALEILVDGNRVLSERLPIGFYGNRPTNFIEIMGENSVIHPKTDVHGHVAMAYYADYATLLIEQMEKEDGIQVLIPGEVIEWDILSYIRDAVALGKTRACMNIGHFNLEELGMRYAADWLKELLGNQVPVTYVPTGDIYRYE